jgi:hypothetical protein
MKFFRWGVAAATLAIAATPVFAQLRRGLLSESLRLLHYPEVQQELKLTPEQEQKLKQAQKDTQAHMVELVRGMSKLSPEERRKRFGTFQDEQDRTLVDLLSAKQRARLRQIEIQAAGPEALLRTDVAGELGLSGDQRQRLRTAAEAGTTDLETATAAYRNQQNLTAAQQEAVKQRISEVRKESGLKLMRILTAAQRKQFEELQGPPFHLPDGGTPVASGTAGK